MKKIFCYVALIFVFCCILVSCENEKIPEHSHTFGEWTTVANASCLNDGLKERICDCGEKETENVPATGHSYIEGVCEGCGDISSEPTADEYFIFTELEDGTYSVAAKDVTNMPKVVVIPAEYNGKAVTKIADFAFIDADLETENNGGDTSFCTEMTQVIIPDSVVTIGNYAFPYCMSLENVIIPDSVTSIGMGAFGGCISLKSITIPDSVTCIGEEAFYTCYNLASVTISNSVTSIGKSAFADCISLTNITIPYNVTSIERFMFSSCSSLTSIVIPDSVTCIGEGAFSDCYNLTSVTIPNSVSNIGNEAFTNCYKLVEVINRSSLDIVAGSEENGGVAYHAKQVHNEESKIVNDDDYLFFTNSKANYLIGYIGNESSLILPNTYNGERYEINDYAFYGTNKITHIVIPNGFTNIGEYAFAESQIISISIPSSMETIGNNAFIGCNKLIEVINNSSLDIRAGSKDFEDIAYNAKWVHSKDSKIENIDGYLFYTYKDEWAHKNINCLIGYAGDNTDLILPKTYNDKDYVIADFAFYENTNIRSITIPSAVTNIGKWAFTRCYSLENVSFEENSRLTSIDSNAFHGCLSLHTNITIPKSVVRIGSSVFDGCVSLKGVDFEENSQLKTIGHNAFSCTGLIRISIPKNVTTIEWSAFCDCYKLTSIVIPDSVTSIESGTFYDCYKLTSIVIPDSVTSISWQAFKGCNSLTDVYYTGTEEGWAAIIIGYDNECLTNANIHYNYVPEE